MPSLLHEGPLEMIRQQPALAATLLRDRFQIDLPPFTEARLAEAGLNQLAPAAYQADVVVLLVEDRPVFGVIVEVQLRPDPRKRFTWPLYAVAARAQHECPFIVMVLAPDASTADWAAQPIELGGGASFPIFAIGPDGIPIITDVEHATREPYLAMLSAIAHGRGDSERALEIAKAAAILHPRPRRAGRGSTKGVRHALRHPRTSPPNRAPGEGRWRGHSDSARARETRRRCARRGARADLGL